MINCHYLLRRSHRRSSDGRVGFNGPRRVVAIVVLVAVMVALGQSALASPGGHEVGRRLVLSTDDTAVHGPRTVRSGRITIELVNRGHEVHIGGLKRISGGKTLADFRRLLVDPSPPDTAPEWIHDVAFSGFAPLSPRHRVGLVVNLDTPGTYVYYCLLTTPSGRAHAVVGELTSFRVIGRQTHQSTPHPDATIVASDAGFRSPVLSSGHHVLRLVNAGRQQHEFAIVRLRPAVTPEQVDGWLQNGQIGPPPATFYGGAQDVGPGQSSILEVRLASGPYMVVDGETGTQAKLIVR